VSGFEMSILVFDRSEASTDDYQVVELKEVIQSSDYLAICLPLSPETTNLIESEELRQMKDSAIIVNTAREEIINKSAIIEAIKTKRIAGYGIETEIMKPISSTDDYLKYNNILINPHNAFNTNETKKRTSNMVVDNVISYIQGKPKNILTS
jgi:phosphoglycerate dehydrogenase-like enzyme